VGDSDPDMVEQRPFLGVDGAGEGLAGGSTSWIVKIRLPLRETLGTCSTSLTFDAFLTFILAGEGRKKNQPERMRPCRIKEEGWEKEVAKSEPHVTYVSI
jgi:hypothetical protein